MSKMVGSQIVDFAGGAIPFVDVTLELCGGYGYDTSSKHGLSQRYRTATDVVGNWSATIIENDKITPTGTLYRVSEFLPLSSGGTRTYLIQVLSTLGGGLHQTMDLLVPEFSPVGVVNTYLTKAYADATYATQGTSGSAGPPGPAGPPGGNSLPVTYVSEYLLLQDTSQPNGTIAFAQDVNRFYMYVANTWRYLLRGAPEEDVATYYVPAGNIDATTGATWADWVTISSSIVIPSWALRVRMVAFINGIFAVTAAGNNYDLRFSLDGNFSHPIKIYDVGASGTRFGVSYMEDGWIISPGTAKVLKVQAERIGGTGAFRVDTNSDFDVRIQCFPQYS